MKKLIVLCLGVVFVGGCASLDEFWNGYSEQRYQQKIAEYKATAPKGYSFDVIKQKPYKLKTYYYRVLQVLGDKEVLACPAYSRVWASESWKLHRCSSDIVYHMIIKNAGGQIYDDMNFDAVYFKKLPPFVYTSITGAQKTVQSFEVIMPTE